jgi:hypothetical protein
MTATEVIREIEALPPAGQAEVIRFTQELQERRQLSGDELTQLARQMTATDDPVAKEALKEVIVRGFYGEGKDA